MQVLPEVEICILFMLEMEMLLQKNSAVHLQKPERLDDKWMQDWVGLW